MSPNMTIPNDQQESILTRLIRMEEKLDGYLFRTVRLENRADDNERRLRTLENGNARILAAAGVVAFLISSGADIMRFIVQ